MNSIEVLHNAARHYCIEHFGERMREYDQLEAAGRVRMTFRAGSLSYSDEAYDLFPRYNVLAAIRRDIEHFVPADFNTLGELRNMLEEAGETAQTSFTQFDHPVAIRAGADERRRFLEFARTADVDQLVALPLLPYRRVLGEAEHARLYLAFVQKWGKWYGGEVDGIDPLPDAITLHVEAMEAPGAYDHLRRVLTERGVTRLLELREWGDGCEIDTAAAEFTYTGAEGYWTSGDMSWMVYASHESSITFDGPLAAAMRPFLPEFDRYLYRGWNLAAYE